MSSDDQPSTTKLRAQIAGMVWGLFAIWSFSTWQLIRAAAWGVVYYPSVRHSGDRFLVDGTWDFWMAIYTWTALGPVFVIGTATFAWIQRNDRF